MNPTPELHQRYLSGLPTQTNYSAHEPARPKSAMPQILLTVVGVVGLILLAFYVALIRPLVKKSQQLTAKTNASQPNAPQEEKEEDTEEDPQKEEPKTPVEPEDSEESPGGGSPRR